MSFCKCKSEIDGILLVVHAGIHDHQNFCESALSVRKTKQFPLPFNHACTAAVQVVVWMVNQATAVAAKN